MRNDLWTDEATKEAIRLWSTGMSARQIAEAIGGGITRQAVTSKAARNRTDFPYRPKMPMKKAPVVATAVRVEPVIETTPLLGKPWVERQYGECAFPVGGAGADTRSCCAPTKKTYCDHHMEVMYVQR